MHDVLRLEPLTSGVFFHVDRSGCLSIIWLLTIDSFMVLLVVFSSVRDSETRSIVSSVLRLSNLYSALSIQ